MMGLIVKLYRELKKKMILKRLRGIAIIGNDVHVSHNFVHRCNEAKSLHVGEHVHLDGLWVTQGLGKIKVGNYCSFRAGTYLGALDSITIGNSVFGAENIFISDNNNHPTSPNERLKMTMSPPNSKNWKWTNQGVVSQEVVIEDNVWLGRSCMIFKGVRIGMGSIVAAGSIVTKSVPAYSIVAGNPARVVKTLENDEKLK
jgi:acetyltransferase-like isoleucine patch superfamily enzyme